VNVAVAESHLPTLRYKAFSMAGLTRILFILLLLPSCRTEPDPPLASHGGLAGSSGAAGGSGQTAIGGSGGKQAAAAGAGGISAAASATACASLSVTQPLTWENSVGEKVNGTCASSACHPQASSYSGFVQWYERKPSTFSSYLTPSHYNPTVKESEYDLIKCWIEIGLPQTAADLTKSTD
jgi:hypothetical protein